MAGEPEPVPQDNNINKQDNNINKTVEVARIIFHVATSVTVAEPNYSQTLIAPPGTPQLPSGANSANMVGALTEALNGLVLDTAGTEFGVVQVQMRAGGSIEFIAIVVATYLAVKQGVEVLDTLQKVAELGRRLVRAVMQAQAVPFSSVHGRVEINPAMAVIGRTGGSGSATTRRGLTFAGATGMSGLLLLAVLNILLVGAVLAVVLTR